MLNKLGYGLSARPALTLFKRFDLTSALPPEISFSRASGGTYLNASGKLIDAASDAPRFDHDENGNRLGLMIEAAATNKCTSYNANPVDTTGFTTSGTGTLTVVDDSTELAAAGLDQICTSGKVFKAEATTASNYIVYIPGSVGNTNVHSAMIYARGTGSGIRTARLYIGGADTINLAPAGDGYACYKLENQTPDASSRKMTLTVDGNDTLYFVLFHLEESAVCSSVIVTEGSSATRQSDRPYIDNITQYPWYSENQGYILARYYLPRLVDVDSYIAVIHDGSTANCIGLRLDQTSHNLRAFMHAASVTTFGTANADYHVAGTLNAGGLTWDSNDALLLSGGEPLESSLSAAAAGMTRLDVGSRNGGSNPLQGYIQSLEIGCEKLDAQSLGARMQRYSDIIVAGGGQSLIRGHFISIESSSEAGRRKHQEIIGNTLPEQTVVLVDGSSGGSAACKTSNPSAYWWDLATDTRGPSFDTFYSNLETAGIRPTILLWGQGEEDSHYIGTSTTREQYKEALEKIFADIHAEFGPIPVFIQRIGRRTSFSNAGGVQAVRDVQQELIDAYSWCYEAAEIYDQGLYDQVHLDDAGFVTVAERNGLSVLKAFGHLASGDAGPRVTGAVRVGTSITVTLSPDAGSDFTPASGIEGFKFFDDSSEIPVAAAVRTDSTTITLTLAFSPSSGTETLYYGYDDMAGLNTANVVRDDATPALPLRTGVITL